MKRYKLINTISPQIPLIIGSYDECIQKQNEYGASGAMFTKIKKSRDCECGECAINAHSSDCAVHNEPAETKGRCDCGVNAELSNTPRG